MKNDIMQAMKTLIKFLKPYKIQAVLAPCFKMLEAFFELFVPLVMTKIIDEGIGKGETSLVVKYGLILVALGIVGLVASVTAQFFSARSAVGFATSLKESLFAHVMSFSFSQNDSFNSSTLITRLTGDVNQVQTGVNMTLRLFLRSPFIVFGAAIMAMLIDVKCALVFCVAIPVLSVIVFGIMLGTVPLFKRVQSALDKMIVTGRENLSGVRVIRAFNLQEKETKRFKDENDVYTALISRASGISALLNPLTYVIVNLALCAILSRGTKQFVYGNMTQGELIAIVNYMSQILVELIKLADLIILLNKTFASADRIEEIFKITPESSAGALCDFDSEDLLSFEDVSFTYAGAGAESLSHISFKVKKGETIGIIGGTGSGKSTLVNLIPGFYVATEGTVKLCGRNIQELDKDKIKERIGIVFQEYYAIKGTIRDNVTFGAPDATEEDIDKALTDSQSKEFVSGKSKGLETEVSERGTSLSGGQKQRLMIARALVRKPEILILDDSSSALDYVTDKKLREAVKKLPMTVFIVSQRTSSVLTADRILVLDDGELKGCGTHEELLQNCPVYREIYESQTKEDEKTK